MIKKILRRSQLSVCNILRRPHLKMGADRIDVLGLWNNFVSNSVISESNSFNGFHYAGYIAEKDEWCLPSWIWTNAAIVREYCLIGRISEADALAGKLADYQQECGGWVVRNDYDNDGAIPMLAPNDSAYIANNAFLTLYEKTNKDIYLDIAKRCADWIIETARPDGMVHLGYNMRDNKWITDAIIVDVGFTGGLFSRLVDFTHDQKYLDFLILFINRYVELFYLPHKYGFTTSIDKNDHPQGGMFGRGQAWALEGLIPAYKILKDDTLRKVIDETIDTLIKYQHKDGSWSYNLDKPLLGDDSKAVSVIAKNMMEWYSVTNDSRIINSAKMALKWCCTHTANEGKAKGGIFSFCMEGAIVHSLYSSCAFVYSSSYAIELNEMLRKNEINNTH